MRRVHAPPDTGGAYASAYGTLPPGKHDPLAHEHTTHTASPRRSHPQSRSAFFSLPFFFPPLFFPFSPLSPSCFFCCSYVSDTAPPCSFPTSRFIDQIVYLAARTCTVHFGIILFLSSPTGVLSPFLVIDLVGGNYLYMIRTLSLGDSDLLFGGNLYILYICIDIFQKSISNVNNLFFAAFYQFSIFSGNVIYM